MRVLFASAETYPLAKTGGLADVSSALPRALRGLGVDVRLLMPGYPQAIERLVGSTTILPLDDILGVKDARLIMGKVPHGDTPIWLIDAPQLYRRGGGIYQNDDHQDWPDNALRFAYLSHIGALISQGRLATNWRPDIVHANDWHTGLLSFLISRDPTEHCKTVFTIHNLAFQGNFPLAVGPSIGLAEPACIPEGMEFHGAVSFLKAGIFYADRVTTVSPSYARQILEPEFGCGMDTLLRQRVEYLTGILNGVDYDIWNPSCDALLPTTYSARNISGKRRCKSALQKQLGLPVEPDVPLMAFISRLTEQKMADVIVDILPRLNEREVQFVLLCEGDPGLENALRDASRRYPGKIAVRIAYEEEFAHQMQAGADILLAPARFEPCGLSQLYAMRYGTLPIVRRTGGLADTVIDADDVAIKRGTATGFVFEHPTADDLVACVDRAVALFRESLTWRRVQLQAMYKDFGCDRSAIAYLTLYRSLLGDDKAASERKRRSSPSTYREVAHEQVAV